ncbi:catalase [Clostridium tarantellae]|uniref:Catalase n=1 Tax=Clostridium tarantellae TaxID=39493 RepID=A0A6I1MMK2_9CLOT|nr:catalase [Clostridium tarantellae]MPQ43472.1 catalase [Clostridium tarantellae]
MIIKNEWYNNNNNKRHCYNKDYEEKNWCTNSADNFEKFTTDEGVPIQDDSNSLTVGENGPVLLEDVQLIEKLAHFDRERIPERVVHAKGAGAHGYFEVKNCMSKYTNAKVFHNKGKKIPVFTRFSTVIGSKGSADTARDPRGFAVKFYTEEGNYDIVGNHLPVFFIRDAMQFADMVHAFKPSPTSNVMDKNRFWDFITSHPESTHMITWVFSDLGTIKSFRTIEGFGVNTYVWVNSIGHRRLVKYHWKPFLGVKTIDRHEAEMLAGIDPDVATRDLYNALEKGDHVKFDLYVQIMEYEHINKLDFDPEDATKLWPEDKFPLMMVGTMTLDKNPCNFFLETEQVAFCPANIIPGVELSNDKLLQGRAFAYHDTQRHRLGANFTQLQINMPNVHVNNNEQDGQMRYFAKEGHINYNQNNMPTKEGLGCYKVKEGCKIRKGIIKTNDFKQAGERYRSLSKIEKEHLIDNIVSDMYEVDETIQRKAVENFLKADKDFGEKVKKGFGLR